MSDPIKLNDQIGDFKKRVQNILPEGGNLDMCFTCGTCASGCPATGLENMDPRKFLRMVLLGMDEQVLSSKCGLDVHNVPTLHQGLPDEREHPAVGLRNKGFLAP